MLFIDIIDNVIIYSLNICIEICQFDVRATEVPIGEDQVQHLELTRHLARVFNRTYKKQVFPEPKNLFG